MAEGMYTVRPADNAGIEAWTLAGHRVDSREQLDQMAEAMTKESSRTKWLLLVATLTLAASVAAVIIALVR